MIDSIINGAKVIGGGTMRQGTGMANFLTECERKLCDDFLDKGIVKLRVEDSKALTMVKMYVDNGANTYANKVVGTHLGQLNEMRQRWTPEHLNPLRMATIDYFNTKPDFRLLYYRLAQNAINTIVGNELVMQRRINLSIQMPHDTSSLLPVHCDTWSGDSPYEVVLWVPLVDCYGTKSMYYCDKAKDAEIQPLIARYNDSEELFKAIEPHVTFMDVKYGECLIFTQNIMHGNRVNTTNETRWSLNCRFKSALSPYADKKLGEFFDPITLRPATILGMKYEYPRL